MKETAVDDYLAISEEAKEIAAEMKAYEEEKKNIRANPEYLDPLVFWSSKAGVYPCLF